MSDCRLPIADLRHPFDEQIINPQPDNSCFGFDLSYPCLSLAKPVNWKLAIGNRQWNGWPTPAAPSFKEATPTRFKAESPE
jgi:hypothetical protein